MRLRFGALFFVIASAAAALEGPRRAIDLLVYSIVAAVALIIPRFWAQLLARGVGWYVVVRTAVANLSEYGDWATFAVLVAACAALVVAGGEGLDTALPGSTFTPLAFRRTLVVSMVAAIAEIAWFAAPLLAIPYGGCWALDPLDVALGAGGALAVIGIASNRAWGLLLQGLVQLVMGGLLIAACIAIHPHEGHLAMGLVNTSIQVAAILGLVIAVRIDFRPLPTALTRAVPQLAIATIAVTAAVCVFTHTWLFVLD